MPDAVVDDEQEEYDYDETPEDREPEQEEIQLESLDEQPEQLQTMPQSMEWADPTAPSFQLNKMVISPELKEKQRDEFKELTRELKVSNITRQELGLLMEYTDLSKQCRKIGANDFADFLLGQRDAYLSGTSSVGGFERKIEGEMGQRKSVYKTEQSEAPKSMGLQGRK